MTSPNDQLPSTTTTGYGGWPNPSNKLIRMQINKLHIPPLLLSTSLPVHLLLIKETLCTLSHICRRPPSVTRRLCRHHCDNFEINYCVNWYRQSSCTEMNWRWRRWWVLCRGPSQFYCLMPSLWCPLACIASPKLLCTLCPIYLYNRFIGTGNDI